MSASPQRWLGAAILVGAIYAAVGVTFAWPVGHVRAWRLGAWTVSGIAYLAHIAYERIRLQAPVVRAALHVAVAVAIGAFGLAAAANIHAVTTGLTAHQTLLLWSLAVWPLFTALPAFLVALGIGAVVARRG